MCLACVYFRFTYLSICLGCLVYLKYLRFTIQYAVFKVRLRKLMLPSGDGEIRTLDPLLARQVLSQLSYAPILAALPQPSVLPPPMGLSGLEPPTSRLSGVRSNRLSYKPIGIRHPPTLPCRLQHSTIGRLGLNRRVRDGNGCVPQTHRHRNSFRLSRPPAVLCEPSYGASLPKPFRKARQYNLSVTQIQKSKLFCLFVPAILCRLPKKLNSI